MTVNKEISLQNESINIDNLVKLFVTPEDEKNIAETSVRSEYEYKLTSKNRTLEVVGTPHPYTLEDAKAVHEALSLDNDVDLVLIEGAAALEFSKSISSDANPEEVIARYGEQTYAAWLARNRGVEVRSWDIPMQELLVEASSKFSNEAIVAWIAGMGAKHIIDKADPLEVKHLVGLISASLGMTSEKIQEELGIELTAETVQASVQKYSGVDFEQLTYDAAEEIATPRHRGEPNDVIRALNELRDRHLLETLAANTDKNNIVTICGKSHAITWRPALEELYKAEL